MSWVTSRLCRREECVRGSEGEGTTLHTPQFTPAFRTFAAVFAQPQTAAHTGVVGAPYIPPALRQRITRLPQPCACLTITVLNRTCSFPSCSEIHTSCTYLLNQDTEQRQGAVEDNPALASPPPGVRASRHLIAPAPKGSSGKPPSCVWSAAVERVHILRPGSARSLPGPVT